MNEIKIKLLIPEELSDAAARLCPLIGLLPSEEGILLRAQRCERLGVSLSSGVATVYYKEKHHFFRELGILAEHLHMGDGDFEHTDDGYFEGISAMIDASRCSVPTVETVKRLIEYFALMGYGMMMLYTEDTVKLDSRPYFGYMRGGYTHAEIREMDDYAYSFGIELVPCIECYAHMERYLIWGEASRIKDTPTVLMAREPETFRFLDEFIGTLAGLFRSRKIHIGMDEAHDMGRGKFLDKNGYVPAFELFGEYMSDLMRIVDKYGLEPMMWSDMYFRNHSTSRQDYYDPDTVIPEETRRTIPENMSLVFWHYGEANDPEAADRYMLKKHLDLGRRTVMATGAWSWAGHFPEYEMMRISNASSVAACRELGVREAMLTVWCNDNAECETFTNLLSLSYFAELCYNRDEDADLFKRRFEAVTGGDFELFSKLSYYHCDYENDPVITHRDKRFLGKSLFWQDPIQGIYELELSKQPRSGHYAFAAEQYSGEHSGKWSYIYDFAYTVMSYLEKKTYIAENLRELYLADDKDALRHMAREEIPELQRRLKRLHSEHKRIWHKNNKSFGWQNMDTRYAGLYARCDTLIEYLEAYLSGELDSIPELAEKRLPLSYHAYITYQRATTVNYK